MAQTEHNPELVVDASNRLLVAGRSSTRAHSDDELVASWLSGLGSDRSRANFATTAERFLSLLARHGLTLRTATVEDVREAIAEIATGKAASSAVQYAQRVKSLLSYAHRLGYVGFNAGVSVRTKGGTVDRAKRIASETEIALLIRAAPTARDRLMLGVGYAGGLRVSELVGLTWADVLTRPDGRVQLSVMGKGERLRPVLLPPVVSQPLLASRGDAPSSAPVFPSRKGGAPLLPRAVNRMIKRAAEIAGVNPEISAHWLRHAHASHALNRGATIAEVKDTLGHSNVSTTSVYLHASPDRSSALVLDEGIFR
jgi:integrase/recombinase XerD